MFHICSFHSPTAAETDLYKLSYWAVSIDNTWEQNGERLLYVFDMVDDPHHTLCVPRLGSFFPFQGTRLLLLSF